MDFYLLEKAPVMELVDMRVLGTRAFGVSVRVRPGAMGVISLSMPATLVDLKVPSHKAFFLALYPDLHLQSRCRSLFKFLMKTKEKKGFSTLHRPEISDDEDIKKHALAPFFSNREI